MAVYHCSARMSMHMTFGDNLEYIRGNAQTEKQSAYNFHKRKRKIEHKISLFRKIFVKNRK